VKVRAITLPPTINTRWQVSSYCDGNGREMQADTDKRGSEVVPVPNTQDKQPPIMPEETAQALRDAIDKRIKKAIAEHEAKYHGIALPVNEKA
jgi:hypothetical protein